MHSVSMRNTVEGWVGDLSGHIWQLIGGALVAAAFRDVLIVSVQLLGVGYPANVLTFSLSP